MLPNKKETTLRWERKKKSRQLLKSVHVCVCVFINLDAYSFFLLCLFVMQTSFLCTKFFTCGIRYCLEIPPSHSALELRYFNNCGIVCWLMDSMNAFSFFQTCQVQKKLFLPSVFPDVLLKKVCACM